MNKQERNNMQRLPTFIFAEENHFSSSLPSIISKLAKHLKEAGYDNFYHEMPANLSLQQVISFTQKCIVETDQYKKVFPKVMNDFIAHLRDKKIVFDFIPGYLSTSSMRYLNEKLETTKDGIEFQVLVTMTMIMSMCMKKFGDNLNLDFLEMALTEVSKSIISDVNHQPAAFLAMLDAIEAAQITYKGIDDPSISPETFKFNSISNLNKAADILKDGGNIDKRNKIMAQEYLKSGDPVFALTGLMHVTGLQELINKWIPSEIARANFDFIYIFREVPSDVQSPEIKKAWEDYRQQKLPLPLGLTLIDVIGKSDEEIIEIVMKHVHERIAEFKALPDHLKVIPDISFTGQLHAQLNNLYGLFARTANDIRATVTNKIWSHDEAGVEPPAKQARL